MQKITFPLFHSIIYGKTSEYARALIHSFFALFVKYFHKAAIYSKLQGLDVRFLSLRRR